MTITASPWDYASERYKLAGLTPRQIDVLGSIRKRNRGGAGHGWSPLNYSAIPGVYAPYSSLKKLVEQGLVSKTASGDYWVTQDGDRKWALVEAMAQVPAPMLLGGGSAAIKQKLAQQLNKVVRKHRF